jgi:hypothetical protein
MRPGGGATIYKIVELSVVTDESLEAAINEWVAQGWQWDGVHFVVSDRSKRPAMAFLAFTCEQRPSPSTDPPRPPASGRPAAKRRSATTRRGRPV